MTNKQWLPMMFCALAVSVNNAYAGSDSGVYVGGSIGSADLDYSDDSPSLNGFDFEDNDTGFKAFIGYNFGLLPLIDIAAELTYVDFGTLEDSVAGNPIEVESDALTAAGIAGFKLGLVGLFGKVGVVNWDTDISTLSIDDSESGTDPFYGLGAKIQLGSLAARAEYELFELDDVDIDYYSVGASITF